MKRLVNSLVIFVVGGLIAMIGLGYLTGALGKSNESGTTQREPTSISDYVATFTIGADGDLRVTERITVEFPPLIQRHGIYRFFDTWDENDDSVRRAPYDFSVTRDGESEPYTDYPEGNGRYQVFRIGSADRTLDAGQHVYELRYRVHDVLLAADGGRSSKFYWDLIPSGWQQTIAKSSLTVQLPGAASAVKCAVGVGAVRGCTATGDGTKLLKITTGELAAHTPLTLQTQVQLPAPERTTSYPWPGRFDWLLGTSTGGIAVAAVLALLAGLMGWRFGSRAIERLPGYPLMYAPPDGLGPAQTQYLVTESTDERAILATLMHAAERGAITFDKPGGPDSPDWEISARSSQKAWSELDPVSEKLLNTLGLQPGQGSFRARSGSVSAGQELATARRTFIWQVANWGRDSGLFVPASIGRVGGLVAIVVALGLVLFIGLYSLVMALFALIPVAFVAGAWPVVMPGARTRRTSLGREWWSRAGGFARILSTPSAQDRFDFAGRKDLYTAYLPYAVAFGVADRWAAKYRTEMGEEPPMPTYWAGMYAGGNTTGYVDKLTNDFSSSVQSSITSYEATLAPSSGGGGGGGFSGGGGGGGGGGGSW